MIYKGANIYLNGKIVKKDIEIIEGKITQIEGHIEGMHTTDVTGMLITPAFIDTHVHLREPGYEYKEDIVSGTVAAARGGFQTIFAMPNTKPCMDNQEMIEDFDRRVKEKAVINVKTFAAISKNLAGEELTDIETMSKNNVVCGFSDDGKGLQTKEMMKDAMIRCHAVGSLISAHAEDERELGDEMGCIHEGAVSEKHNLIGINSASEWKQVQRDVKLVEKTGCQYHVCHVSSKETVAIIKEGKEKGLPVSCEVSPHHLVLCEDDVVFDDGNWKMNPPLRTKEDRAALVEGLNNGSIEVIATDHAPHAAEEKDKGLAKSNFGIIGIEQSFPTLYTKLVKTEKVKLETIIKAMTVNPARLFKLPNPELKVGDTANLTILDLNTEKLVEKSTILSKSKNTPFLGSKFAGWPVLTIVNGVEVYKEGNHE